MAGVPQKSDTRPGPIPANRPTAQQVWLLRAALLGPQSALAAWETWQKAADFENLDEASFLALPLLYHGLRRLEAVSPLLNRLKGIYRQTWYRNRLAVNGLEQAVQKLQAAGLSVMVMGGPAVALLYYQDWGRRPLNHGDLLVRGDQALDASRLLEENGWNSPTRLDDHARSLQAQAWFIREDHQIIRLNWRFLPVNQAEKFDRDCWPWARPCNFENVATLTLRPELQLLHTLGSGIVWHDAPPILWLADAFTIIECLKSSLDWDFLAARATEWRIGLALKHGLECLRDGLDVNVPDGVLNTLASYRPSRLELVERAFQSGGAGPAALCGRLPQIMLAYARLHPPGPAALNPMHLLGFLRWRWGHANNLDLLKDLLHKTRQRLAAAPGNRPRGQAAWRRPPDRDQPCFKKNDMLQ